MLQKGYRGGVINYSINDVQNSHQNGPKHPTTTVPQKEIFLVLCDCDYKAKESPSNLRLALINFMDSLILGLFSKASIVLKFRRLFVSGIRSVLGLFKPTVGHRVAMI